MRRDSDHEITFNAQEALLESFTTFSETYAGLREVSPPRRYEWWTNVLDEYLEKKYHDLRIDLGVCLTNKEMPPEVAKSRTFRDLFFAVVDPVEFQFDPQSEHDRVAKVITEAVRRACALDEPEADKLKREEPKWRPYTPTQFRLAYKWLLPALLLVAAGFLLAKMVPASPPTPKLSAPVQAKPRVTVSVSPSLSGAPSFSFVPFDSPLLTGRANARVSFTIEWRWPSSVETAEMTWSDKDFDASSSADSKSDYIADASKLPPGIYSGNAAISWQGKRPDVPVEVATEFRFSGTELAGLSAGKSMPLANGAGLSFPSLPAAAHPATFVKVIPSRNAQVTVYTQSGRGLTFDFATGRVLPVDGSETMTVAKFEPPAANGEAVVIFVCEEQEGQLVGGFMTDTTMILACRTKKGVGQTEPNAAIKVGKGQAMITDASLSSTPSQLYEGQVKWAGEG